MQKIGTETRDLKIMKQFILSVLSSFETFYYILNRTDNFIVIYFIILKYAFSAI